MKETPVWPSPEPRNSMPANQERSRQKMPPELEGFPVVPLRFEDRLPVFRGIEARKELVRRFGLPNAAPNPRETPFGNTRCVFVDDDNVGKRLACLDPDR